MGEEPEASGHLRFKALIWIFTAPRKSFAVIREHHPWVAGLAVGSFLIVLALVLNTWWFGDAMGSIGEPLEIPYGMVSFVLAAVLVLRPARLGRRRLRLRPTGVTIV